MCVHVRSDLIHSKLLRSRFGFILHPLFGVRNYIGDLFIDINQYRHIYGR